MNIGDILYTPEGHQLTVRAPGCVGDFVRAYDETVGATSWHLYKELRPPQAESNTTDLNEALLQLAAEFDKTVEFTYAKPDGTTSYRVLSPFEVATANNGGKYVIGMDEDRDEPRCFRLNRIKGEVAVVTND